MARSTQRAARATARRDGRQGVPRPVDPVVARRLPPRVVERPLRRPGTWQMEVQRRAGSHSHTVPQPHQATDTKLTARGARWRRPEGQEAAGRALRLRELDRSRQLARPAARGDQAARCMRACSLTKLGALPAAGLATYGSRRPPVWARRPSGLERHGRLEPPVQVALQAARRAAHEEGW